MSNPIVEAFLCDESNFKLYEKYVSDRKLFPSEFPLERLIELIVENASSIKENQGKPLAASLKIKEVAESLPIVSKVEFYTGLIKLLCKEYDEALNPCIKLISLDYESHKEEFSDLSPFSDEFTETVRQYFEDYQEFRMGIHYMEEEQEQESKPNTTIITFSPNPWIFKEGIQKIQEIEARNKKIIEGRSEEASSVTKLISDDTPDLLPTENSGLTERQQALFFYYLRLHYKLGAEIALTVFATVIAKVLRKGVSTNIKNSNLYKFLNNPELRRSDGDRSIRSSLNDLQIVKALFSAIGEKEIVDRINLDIRNLQNGLK